MARYEQRIGYLPTFVTRKLSSRCQKYVHMVIYCTDVKKHLFFSITHHENAC
jgi:hypothetical protein